MSLNRYSCCCYYDIALNLSVTSNIFLVFLCICACFVVRTRHMRSILLTHWVGLKVWSDLNLNVFKGCSAILLGFPGDWVVKNPPAKWEMWVQSLGHKDPLEKEMATHSSILAWRIPWTEEPAGLQSKRVGHDLATKQPPQYFIVNYKYYAVLQTPETYSLCSTENFLFV